MTLQQPSDGLWELIPWQGQEYRTSQYFHREYVKQHPQGGKYRQHKNFLQLLRAIEAYQLYIDHGDIVELSWPFSRREPHQHTTGLESQSVLEIKRLEPLFAKNGYHPLTLLNATAQLALSHHLDDEISQQISVAANTSVARQHTGPQHMSMTQIAQIGASLVALAEGQARLTEDLQVLQGGQHEHGYLLQDHHEHFGHLDSEVHALRQENRQLLDQQRQLHEELQQLQQAAIPQRPAHPDREPCVLWKRRTGKPYLPDAVMQAFLSICRYLEPDAPKDLSDASHWPVPFYRLDTLERAYAEATKQLDIFDPKRRKRA